jgi:hypothetical protein
MALINEGYELLSSETRDASVKNGKNKHS